MKYQFSIIIPTYNGARTLSSLLEALTKITSNYTSELIIIDSGSTDNTIPLLTPYRDILNIRVVPIDKKDFNHGATRNRGARLARGEYVCYFSQDVLPNGSRLFANYLEDFRLHPDVVAVFTENIAYPKASFLQRIENECRWERLDKYTGSSGVLLQTQKQPFVPYIPENYFIWYFFSDTASCFRRSFLLENPFPAITYGEDVMIGKKIIELGLAKVYDTRSPVYHSHEYDLRGLYIRQKESLKLRYNVLGLRERGQPFCKIRKIMRSQLGSGTKALLFVKLCGVYLLKAFIYLQLQFAYGKHKA